MRRDSASTSVSSRHYKMKWVYSPIWQREELSRLPDSKLGQLWIANPGAGGSNEPLAFPINQSVKVTNLAVRSQPFALSACSIVCVRMRPSSSNEKMKSPVNGSSLDNLKIGASPPSNTLRPLLMPFFDNAFPVACDGERLPEACAFTDSPEFELELSPLGSVFQRTTNRSSPQSLSLHRSGSSTVPARTIRSLRICNLTFPTSGTLLHATGTVHNAAR